MKKLIAHQSKTYLKVTEDVLESTDVWDMCRNNAQLHCAHYGQNELKNPVGDQLRLHLQQEGQELTIQNKSNLQLRFVKL